MKHMICSKAICPHYKHEDSQVIYCDGLTEESVVHLAFASKTEALDYKKQFCRDDYSSCGICQMLEDKEVSH